MLSYESRYFRNKDTATGKPLFWSEDEDSAIPFRGEFVPNLKQEEYEQLVTKYDSNSRILDLSKEEELIFYNMIIDQCAKGISVLRKEIIHPTEGSWRILLQWFDMTKELPHKLKANLGI